LVAAARFALLSALLALVLALLALVVPADFVLDSGTWGSGRATAGSSPTLRALRPRFGSTPVAALAASSSTAGKLPGSAAELGAAEPFAPFAVFLTDSLLLAAGSAAALALLFSVFAAFSVFSVFSAFSDFASALRARGESAAFSAALPDGAAASRCPSAAAAQLVCASSARNAASGAFQAILSLLPSGDGSVKSPGGVALTSARPNHRFFDWDGELCRSGRRAAKHAKMRRFVDEIGWRAREETAFRASL
jgi:hypothetical protein